jgi:hypothetical protein
VRIGSRDRARGGAIIGRRRMYFPFKGDLSFTLSRSSLAVVIPSRLRHLRHDDPAILRRNHPPRYRPEQDASGAARPDRHLPRVYPPNRRFSTFDPIAPQRSVGYLLDDLCDVVCILVSRVVVEFASEAGIDNSLFQTYVDTGSEANSFPDGSYPHPISTQLERDELAFGRNGGSGNYLLVTRRLLTRKDKGLCVVHDKQRKQSRYHRTWTILSHPNKALLGECGGRE